jgi:peptidoglycan/xylan/chitin deacetylase (PgdA/CDA1 family)/predicted esterase
MKILLLIYFNFFLFISHGQTKQICITVDDLPTVTYGNASIELSREITNKLVNTFNNFHIPAIGYVNEIQLYSNSKVDSSKIELLETWLKSGYDLGNHTYSHLDFNTVSDSDYFRDIEKGEIITRQLLLNYGNNLNYFRHPYLHTGSDKSKSVSLNKYLKNHSYTVSPVTIDNDDYLFARFYNKAFLEKNNHLMSEIGRSYIEYMEKKLLHFEQKSQEVFGRNIPQTLLIHASVLNADYLDELAIMCQKRGYTFVSQQQVLKDNAYKTKDSYYTKKGISWIYRWGISKGLNENIMEGDISTPEHITQMNEEYYNVANSKIRIDTITLFDKERQRIIPVAIYKSKTDTVLSNKKIILFSHGYGQNKGGDYLAYSYLTDFLASKGYLVISIQHELSTDSLMPLTGIPQIVRRPFWERGTDNILFVINYLKDNYPELDFEQITLIGHSNGGDMTALFPQKYPNIVRSIITLDNRRMPLPKTKSPKVFSLRSSDQPADAGVLPTEEEIKKFSIKIIKLPNTTHNEIDDNANNEQRKEIQNYILDFLNN